MSRAPLVLFALPLAFLLAGCVAPDFVIRIQTPNATNQTLNATPAPVPAKLNLCVFGLPAPEDASLASNLTCRGQNVPLEVRALNNTAKLEAFSDCAVYYLKDDVEGRYLDRALRIGVRQGVESGKSLVLWGEAGTLVHDDEAVLGWYPELGKLVPARMSAPGKEPDRIGTVENASGTIDLLASDALLEGFRGLALAQARVTEVAAENDPDVSAYLRTGEFTTSVSYYAILHLNPRTLPGGLARNHAYYFSFDPQRHAPAQLKSLLAGLAQNWLAWQQVAC